MSSRGRVFRGIGEQVQNDLLDAHRVRFESLANDGFVAEVVFDRDGLVTDYPGIARRIS